MYEACKQLSLGIAFGTSVIKVKFTVIENGKLFPISIFSLDCCIAMKIVCIYLHMLCSHSVLVALLAVARLNVGYISLLVIGLVFISPIKKYTIDSLAQK